MWIYSFRVNFSRFSDSIAVQSVVFFYLPIPLHTYIYLYISQIKVNLFLLRFNHLTLSIIIACMIARKCLKLQNLGRSEKQQFRYFQTYEHKVPILTIFFTNYVLRDHRLVVLIISIIYYQPISAIKVLTSFSDHQMKLAIVLNGKCIPVTYFLIYYYRLS